MKEIIERGAKKPFTERTWQADGLLLTGACCLNREQIFTIEFSSREKIVQSYDYLVQKLL